MDEASGPRTTQNWQASHMSSAANSAPSPQRRNDESWVEISSQPSSSSLSSIGDEIIVTGLRVGDPRGFRRRRLHQGRRNSVHRSLTDPSQAPSSSQDDYEASGSEEDRQLTSSNENLNSVRRHRFIRADLTVDSESDDDENATALGRPTEDPGFRPHPNVFSNPPSSLSEGHRRYSSTLPPHPHSGVARTPLLRQSHTRVRRNQSNFIDPSFQADNDAALRASLTTLLSCAAAARGLSKTHDETEAQQSGAAGVGPSNQPMELRLVPESELVGTMPPPAQAASSPALPGPTKRRRSSHSVSPRSLSLVTGPPAPGEKCKRPSGRASKAATRRKSQITPDTLISPTLLTWVVSAGVVVLVSVVGFGAGYVLGREVGKQEALAAGLGANASNTTSCGSEVIRSSSGGGFRRLKWGTSVGKTIMAST